MAPGGLATKARRRDRFVTKLKFLGQKEIATAKKLKPNLNDTDDFVDGPDLDDFWNDISDEDVEENGQQNARKDISFASPAPVSSPTDSINRTGSRRSSLKGSRRKEAEEKGKSASPPPQALRFEDSIEDEGMDFQEPLGSDQDAELEQQEQGQEESGDDEKLEDDAKHKPDRKKKHRRRPTLMIVDKAQRSGLASTFMDDDGGTRRSSRRRIKPLKWWAGEKRSEYERRKSGVGAFMPTLKTPSKKRGKHFVNLPSPSQAPPQKKRKPGPKKKSKKKEEESDDEVEDDPNFDGRTWIRDAEKGIEQHITVAKLKNMITMDKLRQVDAKGIPDDRLPQAGKWFEAPHFSTGKLVLPPGAQKFREVSVSTEVFWVASSEAQKLEVTISDQAFSLSRGSHFYVPPDNEYEIKNLSKEKEATLLFCLVRPEEKSS